MRVIFIGAANPETLRMLDSLRRVSPDFEPYGFIDNDPAKAGTDFYGLPVFGDLGEVSRLNEPDVRFVNLITGSTQARFRTSVDAVARGAKFTNFIHPSVDLNMTSLGVGNYIQESVILQAEVTVGDNSSIHMGSLIGHESTIGHTVFIAHAVSVSGCCRVGDGTFVGTNATILPRVTVGKWCVIGAGAVVTRDVPDYSVVVGNPARVLRTNEVDLTHGRIFDE